MIADIEARLGETEALAEARENVDDASYALERLQRRQRESEAELQDMDAKIVPLESKLYGGSVRNPKELTDLQKELDSLKQRRSKLDDQGLALIDSVEAATAGLEAAKQELAAVEADWQAEQKHLGATKAKAVSEQAGLDGQREQHSRGMDVAALGKYEALRGMRQGRAVAKIERGTCQGCRISLPTHLTQRVRAGGELIQCPSCERILVAG